MNCDDCRAAMPEFWEGVLLEEERSAVEMHLASCVACRTEAERLGFLWQSLGQIPAEQPPRGMRARFYEKLEAYRQGVAESRAPRRPWWPAVGVSAAMLLVGFGFGYLVNGRRDASEVAQLRNEVAGMRQMVTLSLLQQQGASDRLKGVTWAYRTEQPDTEVLSALLYTVNHDPNVNVRLSAVDALRTFASSPVARKGLQQAIAKQDSPLVQIALIDELTELRDRSAAPTLESLSKDGKANPEVRQRATWALGRLQ
jgi:hypothetical protein